MDEPRSSRHRRSGDLAAGAAIALAGVAAGMFISAGTAPALAQNRGPASTSCVPAIAMERQGIALAVDRSGAYFIVNSSGSAIPVRYRDNDTRSSPGETFLTAP